MSARGASLAALFALCAAPTLIGVGDPRAFNHDIAWLLHCSGLLLDGGVPYVDFIENNPPLILWLGAPAVALARALGLSVKLAFDLEVLALVALALALAGRVLGRAWRDQAPGWRSAILAVLGGALLLVPGYDFGQRDHLAAVFFAPYLLSSAAFLAARPLGRLSGWAGAFAAPGFALKPHFLLVWLAVEGLLLYERRELRALWRPENLAVGALLALYAGLVLLLTPGFLAVAAWSLQVYHVYGLPVSLLDEALRVPFAGLLAFLVFRSGPCTGSLRRVACAALLGLVAVVFLQNRDFNYHYVPPAVVGWLVIGLTLLALVEQRELFERVTRLRVARFAPLLFLLVALAAGGRSYVAGRQALRARPYLVTHLAKVVEANAPHGPIVIYSTRVYPGFPLVNLTGAAWSSRFANLWLVPGSYSEKERHAVPFPYHEPDAMTPLERFQLDAVVQDLQRQPPELILFDRARNKQALGETAFDFREYLERDERFRSWMTGYRRIGEVERFEVFRRARSAPRG